MAPRRRAVLVLGGARSGKSTFAERLAADLGGAVLYVATAEPLDEEMRERIRVHQQRRPRAWRTLEAPRAVAKAIGQVTLPDQHTVLVEDVTLLLSNLLATTEPEPEPETATLAEDAARAEAAAIRELDAVLALPGHVILVSNEVGMGLVPPYPLGRAFRDALGRVNQHLASVVDEVYLLVAGLPLCLKPAIARGHSGIGSSEVP